MRTVRNVSRLARSCCRVPRCHVGGVSICATGGLLVTPESPALEIGSNFTATCVIVSTKDLTADDLYWTLSETTVPQERYTKINRTAVSVTIAVAGEKMQWLYCRSRRRLHQSHESLTYGIKLRKACRFLLPSAFEQLFLLLLRLQAPPAAESGVTWRGGCCVCLADPPERPENLSCVALQEDSSKISSMSCSWDPSGRQAADAPTTYVLNVAVKL